MFQTESFSSGKKTNTKVETSFCVIVSLEKSNLASKGLVIVSLTPDPKLTKQCVFFLASAANLLLFVLSSSMSEIHTDGSSSPLKTSSYVSITISQYRNMTKTSTK